jgi:hypothetical protein
MKLPLELKYLITTRFIARFISCNGFIIGFAIRFLTAMVLQLGLQQLNFLVAMDICNSWYL